MDFGGFFKTAWDWLNSDSGMQIGGAIISGLGAGYMAKKEAKLYEKRLEQEARFKERKASSGGDNYGSHVNKFIAGGQTGLLSNPNYMR